MASVDVLTPAGETAGSVELPDASLRRQVNVPLIHQVVVGQLAAARQGTASMKTRAEVRGGGKKPYRQKGTGRARQGSIRAPQFTGGGVVHGPSPRDYSQRTPKKMKAAALRGALSDRARGGRVHVVTVARRRLQALDQDGGAGARACCPSVGTCSSCWSGPTRSRGRACATSSRSTCSSRTSSTPTTSSSPTTWSSPRARSRRSSPARQGQGQTGAPTRRSPTESERRAGQRKPTRLDRGRASEGRRVSETHEDHRPAGHPDRPRDLREELRPARREQVHVRGRAGANKTQIKIAVEKVFDVTVTGVNTLNRQGKRKRTARAGASARTPSAPSCRSLTASASRSSEVRSPDRAPGLRLTDDSD